MLSGNLTLIVPYYRQPLMLARQIEEWNMYPSGINIMIVDDGSKEEAVAVVDKYASMDLLKRLSLYRILVDIPWNRGGARNLGAREAQTEWILHADIDHVLPVQPANALLEFSPNPKRWYRFERYRRGKADETRMKDKVPRDAEYAKIHEHIDSFLITKKLFWKSGAYDEDFTGCLGGGSPFLRNLEKIVRAEIAPPQVFLEVYTRSEVADSSEHSLSRDTTEYSRRRKRKEATGRTKPQNPIRFPWTKVI